MSWSIYNKNGVKVATSKDIEYNGTFMDECYLLVTVKSPSPISFNIGDYLDYRGERLTIRRELPIKKNSSSYSTGEAFVYEQIRFDNQAEDLRACEFMDIVPFDSNLHFTALTNFSFYVSKAEDLAERIQANLDRIYPGEGWKINVAPGTIIADKEISADKITCWDALKLFNSEFGLSFVVRGRNVVVGGEGSEISHTFKYGKDRGFTNIERGVEDKNVITRLRVFGGTRNLPYRYYNDLRDAYGKPIISESMYAPNLMLPAFRDPKNTEKHNVYIESEEGIKKYGIREGSVYFDGSDSNLGSIYPSIYGMTAKNLIDAGISVSIDPGDNGKLDEIVRADQISDDGVVVDPNGVEFSETFTITLKDLGFDPNDYIISEEELPKISMRSGACMGVTFDISKIEKVGNKIKLTCNRWVDSRIMVAFPNSYSQLSSGDEFVLIDLYMPDVYVIAAEQRLLEAGLDYLADIDHSKFNYSPSINNIFLARKPELYDTIKEGNILLFSDDDLNINERKNISKLIIREGKSLIPEFEVTISDIQEMGTIEKLNRKISNISSSTSYSIEQINNYISGTSIWKRVGGKAESPIPAVAPDFEIGSFSLAKFASCIEFIEDGSGVVSIGFKSNVYSKRGISALGRSTGGTGGGSGGVLSLGGLVNVGQWADETVDYDQVFVKMGGSTHWSGKKLSEIVGLDKTALSEYLTTGGYATQSWVTSQGYLKSYTLPAASASVLGGVRIGSGLSVDSGGILSVNLSASHIPTLPISKISGLQTALDNKLNASTFDALFTPIYEGGVLKSIRANFDFWSVGGVSSLGQSGGGGTGGGSGLIQQVHAYVDLGGSFSDTNLTATFNAYTTNQIHLRVKALEDSTPLTFVSSGAGNVITGISKSGNTVTYTKGLTALTGITKAMVEAVLTGLITSHTHDFSWGNISGKPSVFYTLPEATANVLGGVKIGSGLSVSAGLLSVNLSASHIPALDTGKITSGTLPVTRGGTGKTSIAANAMYYASAANVLSEVATSAFGRGLLNAASGTMVSGLNVQYLGGYTYDQVVANLQAGNVASATKLLNARTINGTSFNGTADIVTSYWGTARNFYVSDATAANTGTAISVNGSGNITLKLPATIVAALSGNASTATALATTRYLWGQAFKGDANVTGSLTGVTDITMSGSLQIGSGKIVYDAAKNALYVIKSDGTALSFYATGGVSSLGFSGSVSGGGSGLIQTVYGYADLGGSFSDTDRTNTFNAYSINTLHGRISSLESGSALSINISGSGNVITALSKSGTVITASKGYAVTSITPSGSGNVVTGFSLANGILTYTLGSISTSITKAQVEAVLTGLITSHTHNYAPLTGTGASGIWGISINGDMTGNRYVSGGNEKPNTTYFGSGRLTYRMLGYGNLGLSNTNAYWYDTIWVSSYTGGDVKYSNLLIFDKAGKGKMWISNTAYDAESWNTPVEVLTANSYASIINTYLPLTGGTMTGVVKFTTPGTTITSVNSTGGWNIYSDNSFRVERLNSSGSWLGYGITLLYSNPYVGINTYAPAYNLHVNGTMYASGEASFGSTITASGTIKSTAAQGFNCVVGSGYWAHMTLKSGATHWDIGLLDSNNTLELRYAGTDAYRYRFSTSAFYIGTYNGANLGLSSYYWLNGYITNLYSVNIAATGNVSIDGQTTLNSMLYFSNNNGEIRGSMADNDYWRIKGYYTASNAGYLEIATADDGNEPIYIRQYTGVYTSLVRTLTLLDGNGNTGIPGTLTGASTIQGTRFISTTGTGTAPLQVSSTTMVNNLNAQYLNGYDSTMYFQGQRSSSSIAGGAPTTAELAELKGLGSHYISYPGATGHAIVFALNSGSTRYVQFYTNYHSGMYWRNSTDSTLSGKPWKLLYDSSNSNSTSHAWSASSLTLAGAISGATTGAFSSNVTVGGTLVAGGRITANSDIYCAGWIRTGGTSGWYSETYGGGIHMVDAYWVRVYNSKQFYVENTSSEAIKTAGGIRASGEIQSLSANSFRIVYGNYGFFIRNDGNNTYFMLTNSGDPYGIYNSLRPLYVSNSSGRAYMGNGLSVNGSELAVSTRICTGYDSGVANSVSCSNWFRSNNESGWYNATYNAGIYSDETQVVRTYGGNRFKIYSTAASNVAASNALYVAGGIAAGDNIWSNKGVSSLGHSSSSDMRLKENISEFDAIGILAGLKIFSYTWNKLAKSLSEGYNNDAVRYGFSAQEVEERFPHMISDFIGGYKAVDYFQFIPITAKAIVEVDDKVTRLEKRVSALEKENEQLHNQLKSFSA